MFAKAREVVYSNILGIYLLVLVFEIVLSASLCNECFLVFSGYCISLHCKLYFLVQMVATMVY